ncbi:hypothetical protein ACFBZI_11580 [Moraxella sp. ZJ142]|uniref:hypothetical protein n=1 Tax=Moraxella marmotae TaxID=3344520 RepID=UPI0035D4B7EF
MHLDWVAPQVGAVIPNRQNALTSVNRFVFGQGRTTGWCCNSQLANALTSVGAFCLTDNK